MCPENDRHSVWGLAVLAGDFRLDDFLVFLFLVRGFGVP